MADLILLPEDDALEKFVGGVTRRLADQMNVPISIRIRGVQGGFGSVRSELGRLHRAVHDSREDMPDAIIVAADTNCRGFLERRDQINQSAQSLADRVVHALPDPHVERWFLIDGAAFRQVVGKGCQAPDRKCDKDRYKNLLADAVEAAGVRPLLGGIEYADDIAEAIDLDRASAQDDRFGQFVADLRHVLNRLKA